MPYTVPVSFDKFYENINLSGDHREIANKRKDDIVARLKNKFTIVEAFSSGSIPRYTALKNYADLDVIVVLHFGKHIENKKSSQVLQEVRDTLSEYKTNVRKNGQAVTLYYKTWPNVDIVPAYRTADDQGNITSYHIPDMNKELWVYSQPKNHSNNINSKASTCGDSFRQIIKMIKWWNHQHGSYLQSYHIEALAYNIYSSRLSDMSWDVYTFFNETFNKVSKSLYYEGSFVDEYLSWNDREEIKKRLKTAKELANSAWYKTYGTNDNHEGAIKLWQQIFGDKFPSYG